MIEIASIGSSLLTLVVVGFLVYWFFFRNQCEDSYIRDDGKVVCNAFAPVKPSVSRYIESGSIQGMAPESVRLEILKRDPTANVIILPDTASETVDRGIYPPGTIIIFDSQGLVKYSIKYVTSSGNIGVFVLMRR